MQDKPDAEELLDALASFLETRIVGQVEGRDRFHAIVGANVARIVARELRSGPELLRREYVMLCDLLGETAVPSGGETADVLALTRELVRRIERGDADAGEFRERLKVFLREVVAAKLAVADPKRIARDGHR